MCPARRRWQRSPSVLLKIWWCAAADGRQQEREAEHAESGEGRHRRMLVAALDDREEGERPDDFVIAAQGRRDGIEGAAPLIVADPQQAARQAT